MANHYNFHTDPKFCEDWSMELALRSWFYFLQTTTFENRVFCGFACILEAGAKLM